MYFYDIVLSDVLSAASIHMLASLYSVEIAVYLSNVEHLTLYIYWVTSVVCTVEILMDTVTDIPYFFH